MHTQRNNNNNNTKKNKTKHKIQIKYSMSRIMHVENGRHPCGCIVCIYIVYVVCGSQRNLYGWKVLLLFWYDLWAHSPLHCAMSHHLLELIWPMDAFSTHDICLRFCVIVYLFVWHFTMYIYALVSDASTLTSFMQYAHYVQFNTSFNTLQPIYVYIYAKLIEDYTIYRFEWARVMMVTWKSYSNQILAFINTQVTITLHPTSYLIVNKIWTMDIQFQIGSSIRYTHLNQLSIGGDNIQYINLIL